MKIFKNLLTELHACDEAVEWANDKPFSELLKTCPRGDWLLWLAKKLDCPLHLLTLAKGRCVETVIHLMKDQRSKDAVNAAIDFGEGKISKKELDAAADAAYAAYAAAAAAADAAYAADAAAAADAAYAAYAAAAAADAAYAADAAAARAAYAAANAAYAADAAWTKNQLQTADICRDILGNFLITEVNKRLV